MRVVSNATGAELGQRRACLKQQRYQRVSKAEAEHAKKEKLDADVSARREEQTQKLVR